MEIALEQELEVADLQAINRCRLYLRVITLADVTNVVGTHILREMTDCETPINTTLKWPKQQKPGLYDRKCWKRLLETVIKEQSKNNELIIPLGKWKKIPRNKIWEVECRRDGSAVITRNKNKSMIHEHRVGRKFSAKGAHI